MGLKFVSGWPTGEYERVKMGGGKLVDGWEICGRQAVFQLSRFFDQVRIIRARLIANFPLLGNYSGRFVRIEFRYAVQLIVLGGR